MYELDLIIINSKGPKKMEIPHEQPVPEIKAEDIYHNKHIDLKRLSKELSSFATVEETLLQTLIKQCKKITTNEPNIIQVTDPVTVIGDIHGQLFDLLKILSLSRLLDANLFAKNLQKVIFLGDYVDRGYESLEVVTLLIALKIEYPQHVFLLRGNHESRCMTEQYNFREECIRTYDQNMYNQLMDFFDSLPLACVVNKSFFCVHGGISDKPATLAKINSIQRLCQIPIANVLFCDLIWSDPTDNRSGIQRDRALYNESRDCSIIFGANLANDFLKENKLTTIVRAHEVFIEGYNLHQWNKESKIPPVITIFSAPNYCGVYHNKGAILKIQQNQVKIKQLKDHEPEKHRHMNFDVFSWTFDEVMGTVHQVMSHLTTCFARQHAPELQDEHITTKGLFFVKYGLKHKKQRAFLPFPQSKITKVNMTQEEERQYLFNRSAEYYGNSQKLAK